MDLGIAGKTALVCAASMGLGKACAFALAREGVNLVVTARGAERLEAAAAEIREATGVAVTAVPGDIATDEGRAAALAAAAPDILVTNAGGPPLGDFRAFGRADWLAALDANMLAPVALIQATVGAMIERGFGRVVNITSVMVMAPPELFSLSSGARAGLTAFTSGVAKTVARHGVTLNSLQPGFVRTARMEAGLQAYGADAGVTLEAVREQRMGQIPARRFGEPEEVGAACAFLCSAHAGYITGRNLLIDGGMYPGAF